MSLLLRKYSFGINDVLIATWYKRCSKKVIFY